MNLNLFHLNMLFLLIFTLETPLHAYVSAYQTIFVKFNQITNNCLIQDLWLIACLHAHFWSIQWNTRLLLRPLLLFLLNFHESLSRISCIYGYFLFLIITNASYDSHLIGYISKSVFSVQIHLKKVR